MDDFVKALAAYTGLWAVTTTLVWLAFKRMSEASSDTGKAHAATQLISTSWTERVRVWPHAFIDGFDGVFGRRHWSWRCLWRSLAVSSIVVLILTLVWAVLYPGQFRSWITFPAEMGRFSRREQIAMGAIAVIPVLIINGLGDYTSLLETRILLGHLTRRSGARRLALILLLDVVLTSTIWIMFSASAWYLAFISYHWVLGTMIDAYEGLRFLGSSLDSTISCYAFDSSAIVWVLSDNKEPFYYPPPSILFYSTLFTSVWIWLFALSRIAVLAVGTAERVFRRSLVHMDCVKKPYLAMGGAWQRILHTIFLVMLPWYLWKIWPE